MYKITSLLLLLVLIYRYNINHIMLTTSSSLSDKSSWVFFAGLSHVWLSSVNPTPSPDISTAHRAVKCYKQRLQWHSNDTAFDQSTQLFTENTSQNNRTSPAIWDHTVLSATRHGWTHPALTTTRQTDTRLTYPWKIESWVDFELIIYWDGLPVSRQSPIEWLSDSDLTRS